MINAFNAYSNIKEAIKVRGIEHIPNNFELANHILESGEVTAGYDAECYYRERVQTDIVGTYKITVGRQADYVEFMKRLTDEKINHNLDIPLSSVTYEVWKNGRLENGQKLGKWLRKKGISQFLLDFYSQQIKDERTVYLSVVDQVQYIAGMSYFSDGNWDSISGSSCQDPRNEYNECIHLLGSLADDKLFIIFLHENIDDLEDMEGKAIARTCARLIHVDGEQYMIGTRLYGNNVTKDILENSLQALNEYGIFSMSQMRHGENRERHIEKSTGIAVIDYYDVICIREEYEEYIDVDCPACGGHGTYEAYSSVFDKDIEIECPACGGSGMVETCVTVYIDEEIEIEDEREIFPYNEEYLHYGNEISITIDKEILKKSKKEKEREIEREREREKINQIVNEIRERILENPEEEEDNTEYVDDDQLFYEIWEEIRNL